MRVGIISLQMKIFVLEAEQILYLGVNNHLRQRSRFARQLQFYLLQMVQIDMCVAERVNEIAALQSCHLRHHPEQKGIGSDIKRHAEEYICAALVELERQLTVRHIELE